MLLLRKRTIYTFSPPLVVHILAGHPCESTTTVFVCNSCFLENNNLQWGSLAYWAQFRWAEARLLVRKRRRMQLQPTKQVVQMW